MIRMLHCLSPVQVQVLYMEMLFDDIRMAVHCMQKGIVVLGILCSTAESFEHPQLVIVSPLTPPSDCAFFAAQ